MPRAGGRTFALTAESPRRSVSLVQRNDLLWIEAEFLEPDPAQPRTEILSLDDPDIKELADDIAANGIVQPLAVHVPNPDTGIHQIIAGARRWTAGRLAGIDRFPCLIQDADPKRAFLLAFTENVHRKALTDMDTATALVKLREYFELPTEEDLASFVHRSLSWVRRMLAASRLDPETRRVMAERSESVALAPHLRPQSEEERKATLEGLAGLANREEKVKFVSRVNDLRRAGRPIDEAISVAEQAAGSTSNGQPIAAARPRARAGRPRAWVPAFTFVDQWGEPVAEVQPARLRLASLFGDRTRRAQDFVEAIHEDLTALRDACIAEPAGQKAWAPLQQTLRRMADELGLCEVGEPEVTPA